jgi:beta-lactam-binding protein with PASTA domain
MAMTCEACGTRNPPGVRFCVNPDCQVYLVWSDIDAAASSGGPSSTTPAGTGDLPASTAVKPGSLPPPGTNRTVRPDFAAGGSPPPANAVSLTAAPVHPPRVAGPPAKKEAVQPPLPQMLRGPLRYEFVRDTKEPVAVKPIEEITPNRSSGQSAASGKQGLWFGIDKHVATVEPGGEVTVQAQVLNKGTVVEGVDMRVLGVPEEWVRVEHSRVNLDVGGQAVVAIHFAPPKATTTPSGPAEVEIAVWSSSNPQVRCAEHLHLEVGAFHGLEIEHPPGDLNVRRSGEFRLDLRNNGNYPIGAGVQPTAGPAAAGKVGLHFEPRSVAIPPGGRASLTVRARAAKRLISGMSVTHALQIHLLGGGEAKPVEVNMVQRPLLPRWAPRVLALLIPVLIATLGVGALHWYKNRPQPVPSVINQTADLAEANLGKAGFKAVPTNASNAKVAPGIVFGQEPAGGAHRHEGTIVAITVSSGPPTVTLTDLTQLTQQQAVDRLRREGLQVEVVMATSPTVPIGLVIGQSPAQATAVPVGSTVKITVSSGAQAVTVPSIKGLTESDAITLLGQVNLRYANGGTVPNNQMVGQVVSQQPAAGTMVAPGSTVTGFVGAPAALPSSNAAAPPKP